MRIHHTFTPIKPTPRVTPVISTRPNCRRQTSGKKDSYPNSRIYDHRSGTQMPCIMQMAPRTTVRGGILYSTTAGCMQKIHVQLLEAFVYSTCICEIASVLARHTAVIELRKYESRHRRLPN